VTSYLGFLPSSDEYKVMALASFGEPAYRREFREIVRLRECGVYEIAPHDLTALFGPARERGGSTEQRHYDSAHSLQVVLEETVLDIVGWLHAASGCDDLCMAGGVALNCVMNARLLERGPFKRIWVQPAAGDSGTALGSALIVDARERGSVEREWEMTHAFLGPEYAEAEIEAFLLEKPEQRT